MSGYVKFKRPLIMHGALTQLIENELFFTELNNISKDRAELLCNNGIMLEEEIFFTDRPKPLKDKKFYFKEKYEPDGGILFNIYIVSITVDIKGCDVAVRDLGGEAEEISYCLPDHLFEM